MPPELETRPGEEAVARAGEAVDLQCRATAGQADTGQDDFMKLSLDAVCLWQFSKKD